MAGEIGDSNEVTRSAAQRTVTTLDRVIDMVTDAERRLEDQRRSFVEPVAGRQKDGGALGSPALV